MEMQDRIEGLERRVTKIEMSAAVAGVHNTNVEKRLSAIEDTLKWLVRLVFGALVLAIIGFVISGGLSGS
tara:strand:+ start:7132 stop:7341 length:210 start_codon:yes stop_codon:yes gene_type:complete